MELHATEAIIARWAARQHGLVTRRQLEAAGVTRSAVRRRVQQGSLLAAGHMVYRVPAMAPTWEQRALAACLEVGGLAVLCRRSAATVWRLDLPVSSRIEVAIEHGRRVPPRAERAVVRRVRMLEAEDCATVGVLPVTTAARTLLDLAGVLQPAVLARVVDSALVRGLVTPDRLQRAIDRLGGRGRRGTPAMKVALVPWTGGNAPDSVAEATCLRLLRRAGLPEPICQFEVVGADGRVARFDFAWPDQLLALEVDGFRWHGGPQAHARDSRRANSLSALGWTILRVTPAELRSEPRHVIEGLRHRLRSPLYADRL